MRKSKIVNDRRQKIARILKNKGNHLWLLTTQIMTVKNTPAKRKSSSEQEHL